MVYTLRNSKLTMNFQNYILNIRLYKELYKSEYILDYVI